MEKELCEIFIKNNPWNWRHYSGPYMAFELLKDKIEFSE